jgi:translation initiation factor 1A
MYKSRIRNAKERGRSEKSREIEFPDNGQLYAVIERMLGNGRVEVYCEDGKMRVARIRGSMRKFKNKTIVETSDLVLIAPWEFELDKGDLIHKYTHEEVNYMTYQGMLPDTIHKKIMKIAGGDYGTGTKNEEEDYIVFANEDMRQNTETGSSTTSKSAKYLAKNSGQDDDLNIDDI